MDINKSIVTFGFKKSCYFGSAFPNMFVLGCLELQVYDMNKCFRFCVFEFILLFKTILRIFSKITMPLDELKNSDFCSKHLITDHDSIKYYWHGVLSEKKKSSQKKVVFAIECCDTVIFEMPFLLEDLNNLVFIFSECALYCFCLKEFQYDFLKFCVIRYSVDEISSTKSDVLLQRQLLNDFGNDDVKNFPNNRSLISLLKYYNDELIILKHLQELYTEQKSDL